MVPRTQVIDMEVRSRVELRVAALWRSCREAKTTSTRTQVIPKVVVLEINTGILLPLFVITFASAPVRQSATASPLVCCYVQNTIVMQHQYDTNPYRFFSSSLN
jgi:hypothetical protein